MSRRKPLSSFPVRNENAKRFAGLVFDIRDSLFGGVINPVDRFCTIANNESESKESNNPTEQVISRAAPRAVLSGFLLLLKMPDVI
jgi:hypothetical protein